MVGPERVLERISEGVKNRKLDGISGAIDLTDRHNGTRLVIEIKTGFDPNAVLAQLFKHTPLQDNFTINNVALVNGRPHTMGLKEMLQVWVDHRRVVIRRRSEFRRKKALERLHLVEGLLLAMVDIDEVIQVIRSSDDAEAAKTKLIAVFDLDEIQAQAILEMRLYKLIGLEIEALMKEHDETLENIAKYEDILEHRSSMAKVIIKELTAFKKAYGKERKTVIDNLKEAVVAAKKIEEQDVVFLMDRFGYAKIVDTSVYERNKEAANAEYRHIFTCKNTDKICIFTDKGQMHLLKVLDLPYGKFRDKGTPIDNLCNYDSKEENVVYLAGLEHVSSHRMLFGTKYAMIKVVDGMEFVVAKKTTAATKLGEEDEVLTVCPLEENDTLVMATKKDMFLRIDCAQIPQKKKGAVGVRGMKLAAGDELKSIHVLHEGEEKEVEVKGKPVALHRLHVGNRDTKGVKK
jgi:DNA gyrase subunit A